MVIIFCLFSIYIVVEALNSFIKNSKINDWLNKNGNYIPIFILCFPVLFIFYGGFSIGVVIAMIYNKYRLSKIQENKEN